MEKQTIYSWLFIFTDLLSDVLWFIFYVFHHSNLFLSLSCLNNPCFKYFRWEKEHRWAWKVSYLCNYWRRIICWSDIDCMYSLELACEKEQNEKWESLKINWAEITLNNLRLNSNKMFFMFCTMYLEWPVIYCIFIILC